MDRVETVSRGRGRPRAADRSAISEVAFRLIRDNGYTATTMADIAAAAGISAPTLFRYFPSKAAVLWFGMEDSARLFRSAFDAIDPAVPLVDAVFDAYLTMLTTSPERLPLIKARIAVVELEPGSAEAAWDQFEEWGRIVSEFVGRRRGIPVGSLEASVVGGMIWAALWAAITAWARSDDPDPSTIVAAARKLVLIGQ